MPEFVAWHPTTKVENVKKGNTSLLSTLLLGDAAFTGGKGLCEFQSVIDLLNAKIQAIQVIVVESFSETAPKLPTLKANGTLQVAILLRDLQHGHFNGLHAPLEQVFELRPVKQG